jgi:hypothetical protein
MSEDSVLQEVRAAREEYARSHGFDVRRIVAELQELDRRGGWRVVRLAPRRPRPKGSTAGAAESAAEPTGTAPGS